MAQIEAVKTPLPPPQALSVLGEALGPDRLRALPMVAAQSAHETKIWQGMWRWNFGNVTQADPSMNFQLLPVKGPSPRFRAFDSPQEGARDYVEFLRKRGVLDYALRGDLSGYIAHLKATGYLGYVGRVAPDGHVVSDAEYDVYGRSIASLIHTLATLAPEPLRMGAFVAERAAPFVLGTPRKREAVLFVSLLVGAAALMMSGSKKK